MDVYSDWIDACDTVARDATGADRESQYLDDPAALISRHDGDDDADILDEDEEDGEADYEI